MFLLLFTTKIKKYCDTEKTETKRVVDNIKGYLSSTDFILTTKLKYPYLFINFYSHNIIIY